MNKVNWKNVLVDRKEEKEEREEKEDGGMKIMNLMMLQEGTREEKLGRMKIRVKIDLGSRIETLKGSGSIREKEKIRTRNGNTRTRNGEETGRKEILM